MSSDKVTEVKKEAIEQEVHSKPIEHQGILEEVAHIGGRIAGAAKNTAVGMKDAVMHGAVAAKDFVVGKETVHHDAQRDWFHDTGVDKAEVMEERKHVLGESAMGIDKTQGSGLTVDQGVNTTLDKPFTSEKKLDQGIHTNLGEGFVPGQGLHSNLDQGFTTEKKDVEDVMKGVHEKDKLGGIDSGKKEFSSGLGDTALDQRDALGGFHDKYVMEGERKEGLHDTQGLHDSATGERPNWFHDTGVSKKEVMEERKNVLGETFDKPEAKKSKYEQGFEGRDTGMDGRRDWFADTGVDKNEVMEERRTVLGEKSDAIKDRFDNTSNTVANKAGQMKDNVAYKAGQLKDTALEKGGQLKDAAMEKGGALKDAALEKGGQLKDAALEKGGQLKGVAMEKGGQLKDVAMEKGGQLKDAALEKGSQWKDVAADKAYQLKDAAADKAYQLKDSALETGDQLKSKAIEAGQATQEKGIAMKAAHEKGFREQEARADKENVRY